MIISQVLKNSINILIQNKITTPRLDAEILLSHILKKPREYILAHPEKNLTKTQITNYKLQITKRAKNMPLAYITGHKEFYGLDFKVNKHILIPRPETELMVDETLNYVTQNMKHGTIIDVGTGSGCIIITLAKILNRQSAIGNRQFLATDISKPALAVARRNAKLHNIHKHIKFHHGNILTPILKNPKYLNNPNNPIIITANLPYLTPSQIKNSPTIQYEPMLALSADPDGLKYYRQLFKQITQITNYLSSEASAKGGKLPITVLLEMDPCQTTKIKQLIKNKLPQAKFQIKKDLRGHNRLVIINTNLDCRRIRRVNQRSNPRKFSVKAALGAI